MKKTIKYLDNDGNYQYATVKDAGDLDKLKTKAKEDLVSAINELATNGIASGNIDEINNKVDQIQQQVNQNADALNMSDQERQEMQQQIAQMQDEVQAKVAEMQKLAEEQNKKLQEASAELKKKADAIDVQKMQQDNAEALKNSAKALEDSLAATNEDLQKTADHLNEMEIQAGVVETSVKELQNGFESKVSSADFNEARTKLQEQETMVRQLNNELSTKASNNELDMVTQRVQKAESDIQQNAQGIKASVTKETMFKEMDDFAKYRENRLKYSRDFSNDWSLNGNDVIDDDHLFDTQHDVKSVSIRNGAYLTQNTDLDTDDMSKTFALAMWVEKGKRPRAWYGSAELTNMKVKEDKGDYQRVYWTFVPTIVKQDIKIAGDTSTQGNLIISEPKLEQSDRPSAWSTNTGDQYATTEKLAHDLKLTADKLESTITKQSEFSDRQLQDESRITQTEHGLEVANQTIVAKTDGLRQEFDGKINATSKSLTTEYQSFTNRALGQMADGGANLILNSSFGSLKNSFDKWTDVNPKARIVTDDNGLKWVKLEQSGLTANSPIGLTSNLFRVKKGVVTIGLDIRTDNAGSIDNDNIVLLESYNAEQKRVFTQEVGFSDFKITRETLFDHGSHRVTYKYNQTRDDTQYMAVHILLPKNGILYATNVLARTIANGEDSGEYAPNDADLREQVVQQRTRIEQNDQAIALKADQTKVTQDIDAAKSSLSGAISRVEQRAANLEVKAEGITSSVSTLSKTVDGISVGGTNLVKGTSKNLYQQNVGGTWYFAATRSDTSRFDLSQYKGQMISGRVWIEKPSADAWLQIWTNNNPNAYSKGNVIKAGQSGYSIITGWTVPTSFTEWNVAIGNGKPVTMGIKEIKIEKGNKPTDWSPAPEDTDASIESVKTVATQTKDGFDRLTEKTGYNASTGEFSKVTTQINEGIKGVSTQVASVSNRLDNLSVGGTNLLKGSSRDLQQKSTTNDWVRLPYTTDFFRSIYPLDNFTARVWIENPNKDSWLQAYVGGNGLFKGNVIKAGQSGYSEVHGTLNKDITGANLVIGAGDGLSVSLSWKELKLEKGNVATDWSPAPEDTDADISALESRASKLEQTDSEIKASVTSVTNDLKNGRGTLKEGILSMTDDHFSTKFSSIDNRLNNIGGTNYITPELVRPSYSNLSYDNNTGIWTAVIGNGSGGAWGGGIGFNKSKMEVPWGQPYTDSVEVYVTDRGLTWSYDINNHGVVNDSNLGSNDNDERSLSTQSPSNTTEIPTNQWYKLTFTAWNKNGKNKNHTALWDDSTMGIVNNTGKSITVKFRHPKQELGAVPTDWSPADVQGQIDGVVSKQAEFQTSIDGVKSTVSTLNNNQAKFTKFEQTDGGFKLVAGQQTLEFGGTNLLKNSDFQQDWTNWAPPRDSNIIDSRAPGLPTSVKTVSFASLSTDANTALRQDNLGVKANQSYMISFWARADQNVDVWVESAAVRYEAHVGTGWRYFSGQVTFRTDNRPLYIYTRAKIRVYISGIKLEQGNVATAWSANPNDPQRQLDDRFNNMAIGGENLIPNSGDQKGQDTSHWYYSGPAGSGGGIDIAPHGFFYNGARGILRVWNTTAQEAYVGTEYVNVEPNTEYTLSFDIFGNTEVKNYDVFVLGDGGNLNRKVHDFDGGSIIKLVDAVHQSPSQSERIVKTFRTNGKDKRVFVRFDNNGVTNTNGTKFSIWVGDVKLEKGNTATAWSPSGTELVDKTTNLQKGLSTAQATIEQNSKSIALKVSKGDVINQINLDTNGVRIDANKIKINGDTSISGTLKVPEVILQGKTGTINLNASNGIQIKNSLAGSDNMVQIGYGAIWLGSSDGSSFYNLITSTKSEYYNKNHRIGAIGQNNLQDNKDIMGMTFFSDMGAGQRDSLSPKYLSIGYAGNNLPAIQTQIRLNNQDYTDNDGNNYKRGVHIEDSLFIRYRDINLTGSKIFVDSTPMAPIFGWVSWSKWKNVHHIALVNPNGFAGYAMSEDGSPVLFGRGTTVGMGFNGGPLEIGSQGDMTRWPKSN